MKSQIEAERETFLDEANNKFAFSSDFKSRDHILTEKIELLEKEFE